MAGITPFKGQKGEAWEGGYRSSMVVSWSGHVQVFVAVDCLPTLVDFAGGAKGGDPRLQIEKDADPMPLPIC
jgi:arylsulfatase A-like enzyme